MSEIVQANNQYNIDFHVWATLKNSLYPGAKDESIKMVVDYCKAAELDPLQKPVHIVPMSVKNALTGKCEFRDIVMAGIGLYRIQASRSDRYAGVSEPEYGEIITTKLGGIEITYPEWCKITVKKIVHGTIVEFSAKEYWIENYATNAKDSIAPNYMWRKRPFGQICKCTEAQALRKAFPEIISHQPTAEEMEGKIFNEFDNDLKNITPINTQYESKTQSISAKLDGLTAVNSEIIDRVTVEEPEVVLAKREMLYQLIGVHSISDETVNKWCVKAGVSTLEELNDIKIISSCIQYIETKYPAELEASI